MNPNKPFDIKDFLIPIEKNFISLLGSIKEDSKAKRMIDEVKKFFSKDNQNQTPLNLLESLYIKVSLAVPQNTVNEAKLRSIKQILSVIKKYSFKKQLDQEQPFQEPEIIKFLKKSQSNKIFEIEKFIKDKTDEITEIDNEKNFMISQINGKLSKISKDLDNYITTSLNLNDPVELDKTDKRMIRSVIDVTHVFNGLNVDIQKKFAKPKNQEQK